MRDHLLTLLKQGLAKLAVASLLPSQLVNAIMPTELKISIFKHGLFYSRALERGQTYNSHLCN